MDYKILLPAAIWQDFDPYAGEFQDEIVSAESDKNNKITNYAFTALVKDGESLRVAFKRIEPLNKDSVGELLVVPDYRRPPEKEFLAGLADSGYTVNVVDISGTGDPKTVFPKAYEYGEFSKSAEHVLKVSPTAKDTCQYLYTVIVKRALIFMERFLGESGDYPVLVGLGDAVEVAMQAAGSGANIKALAALNGSGYREYIRLNKFGGGKELALNEERMCWLTGVASVAYAKYITVPTYIAIGTNSKRSDMDRLENLITLMSESDVSFTLSPSAGEYLLPYAYVTFKRWLFAVFNSEMLPQTPEVKIKINEDKVPCIEVNCDYGSIIKKVTVYYSCGEYNHALRDWDKADTFTVSDGNYLAQVKHYKADGAMFAFAEVEYENGMTLSSLPDYMELSGQPVRPFEEKATRIVFEPSAKEGLVAFTEDYNGTVLFRSSKAMKTTDEGIIGATSTLGGLKTYNIGNNSKAYADSLLQIDLYTESDTVVNLTVETSSENGIRSFSHDLKVTASRGFFLSYQLRPQEFKGENFLPLNSWGNVKSLAIYGKDVLVGNILFI